MNSLEISGAFSCEYTPKCHAEPDKSKYEKWRS